MKSKLRFRLTISRSFGEDRIGIGWRSWLYTPDTRMDFFTDATTWAIVVTRANMKRFRQKQHMAKMRAAKAAKKFTAG